MLIAVLITVLNLIASAPAEIITNFIRGGTSTNTTPVIAPNSLDEDQLCFVDRVHQYNSVPTNYLGAEYIMVANDDKTQADYSLDITLSQDARLLLFLDNRLGHYSVPSDPLLNPDLKSAGMGWVYDMDFIDTGDNIGIDEVGDESIDIWSSIYVKNVPAGVVTLLQQNDSTNPVSRNMYGVVVLKQASFEPFWHYSNKLHLTQTPDWVTVSSGQFGGWFWWNDNGYWHQPFEDTPPGGPTFWAFTDRMTLQYDMEVRTLDMRFFSWHDGLGKGYCMPVIAEDGGSGGPQGIFPLESQIVDNLEVAGHQFSVNGGKAEGEFSPLEFIHPTELESYFRSLPGVDEADAQAFINSDTFRQIMEDGGSSPLDMKIGVQHAQWDHPDSPMIYTTESIEIAEAERVNYGVSLRQQPPGQVTLNVVASEPDALKIEDADANGVLKLSFDQTNWDQPQTVSFVACLLVPLPRPVMLAHYLSDDPTNGAVLPVTILDKETGGMPSADGDTNGDRIVNYLDFAVVANDWLKSTLRPQDIDIWDPGVMKSQDIGTTSGSALYHPIPDFWTIEGDGGDIWNNSDQFHFLYRHLDDPYVDHQLTVTVLSLENTNEWAKAGLMYRRRLTPESAHAMIVVTPEWGVAFQCRPEDDAASQSFHGGQAAHLKPPVSLRMVKTPCKVTGYYYADGRWVELGNMSFDDSGWCNGLNGRSMGMAVTSHAEGVITTATFSRDLVAD